MTHYLRKSAAGTCFTLLLLGLTTNISLAQPGQGQGPGAGRGGPGGFGLDSRAESLTYHFEDTDEDMSYCLFVSSKVKQDQKAPLIVSLHGMGATPDIMCNSTAVDLAEEGGYILVAPMGYSTMGWFGSPVISMGGAGRGRGPGAPGAAPRGQGPAAARGQGPGAPGAAPRGQGPGAGGGRGARGGGGLFGGGGEQPENLAELSEKDVMNVLAMVEDEYTIDEDRIYLTGHSMGGAGTYFLGSKHADIWAAIAPVSSAAFMMTDNRAEILKPLADAGVPVMVVHGDADEVVPVTLSRDQWVPTLEELGIEHEFVELPGVTHGPAITESQKYIYDFFAKHSK